MVAMPVLVLAVPCPLEVLEFTGSCYVCIVGFASFGSFATFGFVLRSISLCKTFETGPTVQFGQPTAVL